MKKSIILFMIWIFSQAACSHKPEEIHGKIGAAVKLDGEFIRELPGTQPQDISYSLEITVKDVFITRQINKGFRKGYIAHENNRFLLARISFNNLAAKPFEIESVFDNFSISSDENDCIANWKKSIHAEWPIQGTQVLKLNPVLEPRKQAEFWVIFMIPEDMLEDELYFEYTRMQTVDESQLIFRIQIKNSGSYNEDKKKYDSLTWT